MAVCGLPKCMHPHLHTYAGANRVRAGMREGVGDLRIGSRTLSVGAGVLVCWVLCAHGLCVLSMLTLPPHPSIHPYQATGYHAERGSEGRPWSCSHSQAWACFHPALYAS